MHGSFCNFVEVFSVIANDYLWQNYSKLGQLALKRKYLDIIIPTLSYVVNDANFISVLEIGK